MISYFVSYAHDRGFGCTEIQLRYPVRSMKDVGVFIDLVEKSGVYGVVILNFQRFESAPSADQPVSATSTAGEPS